MPNSKHVTHKSFKLGARYLTKLAKSLSSPDSSHNRYSIVVDPFLLYVQPIRLDLTRMGTGICSLQLPLWLDLVTIHRLRPCIDVLEYARAVDKKVKHGEG